MQQIIQHLKNSQTVLILSHANPDGDAIGSLIAMGRLLDQINKHVFLYNESPIPAVYRFLPDVSRVKQKIDNWDRFDTAVILDCGDFERVGSQASKIARIPTIINIDHHVTNTGFGHVSLVDPDACATSEIVYRLIEIMLASVDEIAAAAIYTGILTDTGSFRFSNTNRAAFEICEKMVSIGVDPYKIAQQVYGTYSLGRIKLLNLALDSIEISKNGKLSLMAVTRGMMQETSTRPEDIDGLINYAKGIEEVKVAVLIQELNDNHSGTNLDLPYHVSMRSDGTIDVAAIASSFGGGGHSSAAGFSIQTTLPEIKSRIIGLAERF